MPRSINWLRILFIVGVTALIIGAVDPLEGSVVILAGSLLITLASYLRNDRHRRWFGTGAMLITIGVGFMFYFSWLGGFGGDSKLSWWWGLLILPYPVGWVMDIVVLIRRIRYKAKLYDR